MVKICLSRRILDGHRTLFGSLVTLFLIVYHHTNVCSYVKFPDTSGGRFFPEDGWVSRSVRSVWRSVEEPRAASLPFAIGVRHGGKPTNKHTNPFEAVSGECRGRLLDTDLWLRPKTRCQDNMPLWPGIAAWGSSRRSWKADLMGG